MIIDGVDVEYLSTYEREKSWSKKERTKVLVVPNNLQFDDIEKHVDDYSKFLVRGFVEENFAYRQIIPYCLVFDQNAQKFLVYKRQKSSTETRLHDLYTIGIGGHVEEQDGKGWNAVANAMRRELYEEIGIIPKKSIGDIYIQLSSTDVDKVHLGIAKIIVNWDGELVPSDEIPTWRWRTLSQLKTMNLETWSAYCVEYIERNWSELFGSQP